MMTRAVKYVPLTFITSSAEKERLIRNTILLRHFVRESQGEVDLSFYIEGTQYGFNAPAKESGTNKYVRISDISNGEIDWESVPFCDCDEPESYLLKKDDLVVARTGGTTGKSYMVSAPPPGSIYAGYLIRVRANQQTNPLFLSVFLNSYIYWSQITSLNRDEFRPSVNAEKLKALRLPQFERKLQDRVVRLSKNPAEVDDSSIQSELDLVLARRNRHESIVAEVREQEFLLEKLKQAILQEAISGKLTADWRAANPNAEPASEFLQKIKTSKAHLIAAKKLRVEKRLPKIAATEVPFQIPNGWEWCRMGNAGIFQRGKSKHRPRNDQRLFEGGEIPFVQTGDVARSKHDGFQIKTCTGYYNEVGLAQSRLWPTGTMCITIAANIAETGFLTFPACLPDSVVTFTCPVEGRSAEYVRMFIEVTRTMIEKFAPATAQKNINLEILTELLLPLPPLAEQTVIVERVARLMLHCRKLAEEVEHSRTHAAHLLEAVLGEAFSADAAEAFAA